MVNMYTDEFNVNDMSICLHIIIFIIGIHANFIKLIYF